MKGLFNTIIVKYMHVMNIVGYFRHGMESYTPYEHLNSGSIDQAIHAYVPSVVLLISMHTPIALKI